MLLALQYASLLSWVMGPFAVVFIVVVVCLVLYAVFVALVVSWVFMCFCSGYLPSSVVPSSVLEDLVAGRVSLSLYP